MPRNSISKSTDGRYSYSVSDSTGKRHFIKSRKNELKKEFAKRCEELDGKLYGTTSAKLKDLIQFYLDNAQTSKCRKTVLTSLIKPFAPLLETDYRDITKQDVVNCLKTKSYSAKSLSCVIASLSTVCNFYCDYYELPQTNCTSNVAKYLKTKVGMPHKEISYEDYKRLTNYLKEHDYELYCLCTLLWETGMRPSEALGNNRYDDKFIYVEKARTDYGWSVGKTKNANRKIPLSNKAKECLIRFDATPHQIQIKMRSICNKLNLTNITLYDFRHTFASRMARGGANIKALQQVMGHATPSITLSFYVKANDEDLLNLLN